MIPLTITPNLDLDPWDDLRGDPSLIDTGGVMPSLRRIGILPQGMQSGRASVAFVIDLPDGRKLMAETSLALFRIAARAIEAAPVTQMEDL